MYLPSQPAALGTGAVPLLCEQCLRLDAEPPDGDVDALDYAAMRPLLTGP